MYADVAFTAIPENSALGIKGWIVNGIYEDNTASTRTVRVGRNTTVKVVFEAKP
jgi:hypothetical protein